MTVPLSRRSAAACLVVGVVTLAAGCGKGPPQLAPPEPPGVAVVNPVKKAHSPVKDFTGWIATKDPVKVQPQVTGTIKARKFKDGDVVVKDKTVLFEIDPVLFDADVKKAIADQKKAEADVLKADADIANGAAQLALDRDTRDRVKRQLDTGGGSKTDLNTAEARVVADQAAIDVARANKALALANKEAAEATITKARQNLAYCTITAPTTGRVNQSNVAEGNLVSQYQTVLAEIFPLDPIYVYWEVDELTSLWYRDQIKKGVLKDPRARPLKVWIKQKDQDEFARESTTDYIDPVINRETGTRVIRAEFPNKEEPLMSGGDSVRVRVEAGAPRDVIMIPEAAVLSQARQKFVYVVNANDEAEMRVVELGPTADGVQIIDRGLTPDDRVAVSNLLRVRPGIKVKVQTSPK
jgi:RND family efflux transporter MFP subunit